MARYPLPRAFPSLSACLCTGAFCLRFTPTEILFHPVAVQARGICLHTPRYARTLSPRLYCALYVLLVVWVVAVGAGLSPPGADSYLDAHLACTCSATNFPSFKGRPSTNAWDLSTKVSGKGSLPT